MALLVEAPYESLIDLRERAKAEIAKVVIGQERAVELLLVAALARGHVLLEGPPGSAKTLLARATAHMLGATFKRIQFTPDTTPAELTGLNAHPDGRAGLLPRLGLHERAPGRRDQPHASAHAGRAARGDAGAPGHGRGEGAQAPRPVPRDRDAEPVRAPRRVRASRVAARPLPLQDRCSTTRTRRASTRCSTCRTRASRRTCSARFARCSASSASISARDELDATELPEEVGRYMVAIARGSRDVPGVELGVSSRGIMHLASAAKANARLSRPRRGHHRGRAGDRAVRPAASPDPRGRPERRRRAPHACSSRFRRPSASTRSASYGNVVRRGRPRGGLGVAVSSALRPPRARAA